MNTELCEALIDVFHKHVADLLDARAPEHCKLTVAELVEVVESVQKGIDLAKKYDTRPLPKLNNVLQVMTDCIVVNLEGQCNWDSEKILRLRDKWSLGCLSFECFQHVKLHSFKFSKCGLWLVACISKSVSDQTVKRLQGPGSSTRNQTYLLLPYFGKPGGTSHGCYACLFFWQQVVRSTLSFGPRSCCNH